MPRRPAASLLCLTLVLLFAAPRLQAEELKSTADDKLRWYDVRQLGVEGQGWTDTLAPYDRLPGRAKGVVRDAVWNLSRDSAGMYVRFKTASPAIHAAGPWLRRTSPCLICPPRESAASISTLAMTGVPGAGLPVASRRRRRLPHRSRRHYSLRTRIPPVSPAVQRHRIARSGCARESVDLGCSGTIRRKVQTHRLLWHLHHSRRFGHAAWHCSHGVSSSLV